jgi:hypothetical protein
MAPSKITFSFLPLVISLCLLLGACKKEDVYNDPASPEAILSHRPFEPVDKDMYFVYATRPPATGPVLTEQQAAQLLRTYADADPWVVTDRAMAVFNDTSLRRKVQNPAISAAIAALNGYPGGNAAINFYTQGTTAGGLPKVASIKYGPRPSQGVIIKAEVNSAGEMFYTIDDRLIAENPFLLTPLLLHEAIHQDNQVGREEEIVAMVFQSLFTLLQLKHHPDLALLKTELSQSNATWAMGLFNGGEEGKLGILGSNGYLFPSSQSLATSFVSLLAFLPSVNSTGNTVLLQYLIDFLQSPVPLCSSQTFNDQLLLCLDQELAELSLYKDSYFSPEERIKMGEALKLKM